MALEWLKSILGDAYTEDVDKKVSGEIGKNFVARADFNAANEAKKTLEEQLNAAGETIAGFEAMDIDGIKAEAAKYKADAEAAKQEAAAQLEAAQFNALLEGAIRDSKGRNITAIKAMLDLDTLRTSKNQKDDIKAALEAVYAENAYLLEPDKAAVAAQPYASGTGSSPATPSANDIDSAFSAALFGKKE